MHVNIYVHIYIYILFLFPVPMIASPYGKTTQPPPPNPTPTIDTLEAETLCPPKLATLNWACQQQSVLFVFGEFENPKQCSCVFAGVKSAWLSYS